MPTVRRRGRSVPGWTVDCDYDAALNVFARSGREPPVVSVELRPLPPARWQVGQ
ncbi:hypothetical protein [Conexivisphaera calida]|uniref:hypothetical protein n=1 Tax=Conexivisphaera calida TaxID=1874277 RepID=UPI00157A2640|nr:hypothetical protein [Conexivisphaera calida]